ncbi:kinase-like domain, phloem protein 2-like protein [Tanacetum coccineum]
MATFLNKFQHLEIQLEKIISATNNFDDSRVIGSGGFGNVYRGEMSHPEGKIEVAFKRLDRKLKYGQGDPEFFKEVRMLSSYKHDNLISLLGYCNEGNEMILMYEYASRGSLERVLNDAALTWTQRLKIYDYSLRPRGFRQTPPKGFPQDEMSVAYVCKALDPDLRLTEPIYPEYIPLEDEHVFPAGEQPLPLIDSPTAESPDMRMGSGRYPMDGGDDGDDDDGDSSRDDANDEDEDDKDDEEEEACYTPPSTDITLALRIYRPASDSISLHQRQRWRGLLGSSLLGAHGPPLYIHHHHLCITLLPSSGVSNPNPETRMALSQALIDAVVPHYHHSIPHYQLFYYIPPPVDCRRLEEKGDRGLDDVGYGIRDTWVDPAGTVPEIAPMIVGEVNTRITELVELHEHDTQDLYALLDDAQDRLSQATHQELQTHRDHVYTHETHLQAHQTQLSCRAELLSLREQRRRARQLGPEARIPDHQDASGDADNPI